jgi:hypothetical protein
MATTTQVEVARDPSGLLTRTVTKQSFTWENPSADARSYRVNQVDGVVTIVEEFFDVPYPVVFSVDVSTTTEPLESHRYYTPTIQAEKDNWLIWKSNPSLFPNPALSYPEWLPYKSTDPKIFSLWKYYILGVSTYFAPRVVIKKTTIETSAPDTAQVGLIADPGYPGDLGPVNCILLGLSAQQEGQNYRVTREYLASPQGTDWDAGIYT